MDDSVEKAKNKQTSFKLRELAFNSKFIDFEKFKPLDKKLQIAYMPRKRPHQEVDFIRGLTTKLIGEDVRWVPIDKEPESKVAKILGESAIFLSLSYLEGFGLPPIEAMACGCVVVGYHGQGGLDYAKSDNGVWCEEGNPTSCVQALQKVVGEIDTPEIRSIIDCGVRTASQYTLDRQEKELLDFVQRYK